MPDRESQRANGRGGTMLLATTTKWNSPDKNMEDRNMERRGKGRRYRMLRAFRGIGVPGQAKTWTVGVPPGGRTLPVRCRRRHGSTAQRWEGQTTDEQPTATLVHGICGKRGNPRLRIHSRLFPEIKTVLFRVFRVFRGPMSSLSLSRCRISLPKYGPQPCIYPGSGTLNPVFSSGASKGQ